MTRRPASPVNAFSIIAVICFLTIVFILLKISNVVNWDWMWVFSPVWINWCVCSVVFIIYMVVELWKDKRNLR